MNPINKALQLNRSPKGFSILESMVGLAIGAIVLAAALTTLSGMQRTQQLGSAGTTLHESERFITHHLNQILRQTGYRSWPDVGTLPAFSDLYPSSTPVIEVFPGAGLTDSDALLVRFQGAGGPDGSIVDCLGTPVAGQTMASNRIEVLDNGLSCTRSQPGGSPATATHQLSDEVSLFKVRLGEDLTGDGMPNRYVAADYPQLDVNRVVAIRYFILLQTASPTLATSAAKTVWLGQASLNLPHEGEQTRLLTQTIYLRNVALATGGGG